MAKISYSSGTATVTGVEDSPLNVNDKPPSPKTAAITGVVFYKNQIVEETEGHFNTVEAKKNRSRNMERANRRAEPRRSPARGRRGRQRKLHR